MSRFERSRTPPRLSCAARRRLRRDAVVRFHAAVNILAMVKCSTQQRTIPRSKLLAMRAFSFDLSCTHYTELRLTELPVIGAVKLEGTVDELRLDEPPLKYLRADACEFTPSCAGLPENSDDVAPTFREHCVSKASHDWQPCGDDSKGQRLHAPSCELAQRVAKLELELQTWIDFAADLTVSYFDVVGSSMAYANPSGEDTKEQRLPDSLESVYCGACARIVRCCLCNTPALETISCIDVDECGYSAPLSRLEVAELARIILDARLLEPFAMSQHCPICKAPSIMREVNRVTDCESICEICGIVGLSDDMYPCSASACPNVGCRFDLGCLVTVGGDADDFLCKDCAQAGRKLLEESSESSNDSCAVASDGDENPVEHLTSPPESQRPGHECLTGAHTRSSAFDLSQSVPADPPSTSPVSLNPTALNFLTKAQSHISEMQADRETKLSYAKKIADKLLGKTVREIMKVGDAEMHFIRDELFDHVNKLS